MEEGNGEESVAPVNGNVSRFYLINITSSSLPVWDILDHYLFTESYLNIILLFQ